MTSSAPRTTWWYWRTLPGAVRTTERRSQAAPRPSFTSTPGASSRSGPSTRTRRASTNSWRGPRRQLAAGRQPVDRGCRGPDLRVAQAALSDGVWGVPRLELSHLAVGQLDVKRRDGVVQMCGLSCADDGGGDDRVPQEPRERDLGSGYAAGG